MITAGAVAGVDPPDRYTLGVFTGIVEERGTIVSTTRDGPVAGVVTLVVEAPFVASGLPVGASVAVNGVCLTAVDIGGDRFRLDVVPETLSRTSLGALLPGSTVNLERAMPAAGRFDGHIVQGHVDGVGTVSSVTDDGGGRRLTVTIPAGLGRYIVEKGSVTVDGVSLTVAALGSGDFAVALIPHTLATTTLGDRVVGDPVDLEVDIVAKYVERLLETS